MLGEEEINVSIPHENIMVLPPRTHDMVILHVNNESFLFLPVICSSFISDQNRPALY